ncbi:hypothetical protein ACOJQI_11260 [Bacillus salacetis]|uniref:hypothetical protein n=1 Tax=Bacillus salacetis TaxID=2315464 RepID=UPI003BA0D248
MNPEPGQTSGNGNPAILFLFILVIMFFSFVYLLTKVLFALNVKLLVLRVGMALALLHLVISFLYQRSAFAKYKKTLAERYKEDFGFVDWQYIDSITSFMSIHVNKQFFNVNTYMMFLTASLFFSLLLVGFFNKKWQVAEREE